MLTRQEKEKLVIDLYNQGKTIREISKEARMSFRDIGAILKKASPSMSSIIRRRTTYSRYSTATGYIWTIGFGYTTHSI